MTGGVNPTGPSQKVWQVLTPEIISRPVNHPGAVKIDYPPDAFGSQRAEKKKGGFIKKALIALGVVGLACVALVKGKSAGLFKPGPTNKTLVKYGEVTQKLIKNNIATLDDIVEPDKLAKIISDNADKLDPKEIKILQKTLKQSDLNGFANPDNFVNKFIKKPLGIAADFVDDKWQFIKSKATDLVQNINKNKASDASNVTQATSEAVQQ